MSGDSLAELASSVGLRDAPQLDEGGRAELMASIKALCDARNARGSALVPNVISVRSLLYFSRKIAKELSLRVPLALAQMRAFASHLQLCTPEQTRALWGDVQRALGWSAAQRPEISVKDVVKDALDPRGCRRPLLFLYENLHDIYDYYAQLSVHMEKDTNGVPVQGITRICPTVTSLVASGVPLKPAPIGEASLHSMIQLRAAVEKGDLIVVLNPEPILEGIHALLNEPTASVSTLQLRQAYESVQVCSAPDEPSWVFLLNLDNVFLLSAESILLR